MESLIRRTFVESAQDFVSEEISGVGVKPSK